VPNLPAAKLPGEWYEELRPGVRRITPPGVSFRWIDVVLDEADAGEAARALRELDFPEAIIEAVGEDARGESLRYRRAGVSLLRLEIPHEILFDIDQDYMLAIVIADDRLATIRRHRLGVVEDACSGIADLPDRRVSTLAATVELADEFLDRVAPSLRRTALDLDDIESSIETSRASRVDRVAEVRRVLLGLDRHLDPLQTALQRSLLDSSTRSEKSDVDAMRGLLERANWLEHRIHGQLDRARVLADRDHIRAMDDLATSTYRLSWIATIFLPLTFMTGLLGINVDGIPFAHSEAGFWIVCGILTLIAAGTGISLALVVRSGRQAAESQSRRFTMRRDDS
jgi:zinc transporter